VPIQFLVHDLFFTNRADDNVIIYGMWNGGLVLQWRIIKNLPLGAKFIDGIEISSSSMSELGIVMSRTSFSMCLFFCFEGGRVWMSGEDGRRTGGDIVSALELRA